MQRPHAVVPGVFLVGGPDLTDPGDWSSRYSQVILTHGKDLG